MPVPNYFAIVVEVFNSRSWDLSTVEQCGIFTEACAFELYKVDSYFGNLKKNPGQNQYNGHAVDAILYYSTGQSIDLIINSGAKLDEGVEESSRLSWQVDIPRYGPFDWITPKNPFPDISIPPGTSTPPNSTEGEINIVDTLKEIKALLLAQDKNINDISLQVFKKRELEGVIEVPYLGNALIRLDEK